MDECFGNGISRVGRDCRVAVGERQQAAPRSQLVQLLSVSGDITRRVKNLSCLNGHYSDDPFVDKAAGIAGLA